jgi:cytochrome P450
VLVAGHRDFTKHTFQYRLLASVTGDGLLTMDGPDWLARRRLEQPLFHRDAVHQWTRLIVTATDRLLESWELAADEDTPRDIALDMLRVALDVVTGTLCPASFEYDHERVLRATMTVLGHIMGRARTLGVVPPWLPTPANRRFRSAIRELDEVLYGMIRAGRRAGPGTTDLLGHLLFDAEGRPSGLSEGQLRDELLTMIIAGHETVASALAWAWDLLAHHPEIDRALARESARTEDDTDMSWSRAVTDGPLYSAQVFDETLRLYPPAWVITRKAVRPTNVAGIEIPAGALVAISPYVLHRDDRLWRHPDRFDPERFSADGPGVETRNAFIPFGAGPHLCIGAHMARLEARILLTRASRRFRLTALSDRPSRVEPGVTLHPKGGLWMRVERRTSTGPRG